ncbi:hypothetical protein [Gordonia sp. NPDC003429]
MMPQSPAHVVPARRPLGDRGPWWAHVLVGTAVVVVFVVAETVISYALVRTWNPGVTKWISLAIYTLVDFTYVLVLAVWARSGRQRVAAVLFTVAAMILQRALVASWYAGWLTGASGDLPTVVKWLLPVVYYSAIVLGWTIARRRTWFTLLGVVPGAAVIAVAAWISGYHYPHFEGLVGSLQSALLDAGLAVAGIVVFWACDGLGLLVRRNRPGGADPAAIQPPYYGRPFPPAQPFHQRDGFYGRQS